jgi:hypothetical protein
VVEEPRLNELQICVAPGGFQGAARFYASGGGGGVIRKLMKLCDPLARTLLSCSGMEWSGVSSPKSIVRGGVKRCCKFEKQFTNQEQDDARI